MRKKKGVSISARPIDRLTFIIVFSSAISAFVIISLGFFQLDNRYKSYLEENQQSINNIARLSNLLVENRLINSARSIGHAQKEIEEIFKKRDVFQSSVSQVLRATSLTLNSQENNRLFASLFYFDHGNKLIAESNEKQLSFSELSKKLSENNSFNNKFSNSIYKGSIFSSNAKNEQFLFMTASVYDKQNVFAGTVVLQINFSDLSSMFEQYVELPLGKNLIYKINENKTLLSFQNKLSVDKFSHNIISLLSDLFLNSKTPAHHMAG